MSEPTSKPVPYQVVYSDHVLDEVRRLIAAAATPEQARKLLTAFREINRLLHVYPQFGEPLIDLHEPGQMRIGTVDPVVIRYGVYDDRRLVLVVALPKLLQQSPESNPNSE